MSRQGRFDAPEALAASLPLPAGIDLAAVVAFVQARRQAGGGFGATPRLPATVEDTFQALATFRALADLGAPGEHLAACRQDQALQTFLARMAGHRELGLRTMAQLVASSRLAAADLDLGYAQAAARRQLGQQPGLEAVHHAWQILGPEGLGEALQSLGPAWLQRLTPSRPTCRGMMLLVEVAAAAGEELPAARTGRLAAWFAACQSPDGGFGFFPGTTSFIEHSLFCLRGLSRLGAPARDPDAAVRFLASCQTRAGGFGRRANAAPFLDATAHGLAALAALCGASPPPVLPV
ncbi:MAG: prenyltransferase/squalene oxidase repeat-containing protein [Thermodesulfobacteriota bacterium]